MYNYTHTALAILTELGIITEEGARKLAKEMASKIHPSSYDEALAMISTIEIDVLKAEPWRAHIQMLEKRLSDLEKKQK